MRILLILPISFLLNIFIKNVKFDPFVFISRLHFISEDLFRKKGNPENKILTYTVGILSSLILIAVSFLIPFFLLMLLYKVHFILGLIIELALCYMTLGIRKPLEISSYIYHSLTTNDLKKAKSLLKENAEIDTEDIEEEQIIKNTIEYTIISISEDYIYPAIFLLLGGAPLCIAYKVIYVLSESSSDTIYIDENKSNDIFGIFNIKLCYILNIIPSFFTSLVCIVASIFFRYEYKNAFTALKRDGKNNKARLEASVAGALDIELGGEYIKDGEIYDRPLVGEYLEDLNSEHIEKANKLMLTSAIFSLAILIIIKLISMLISSIIF
ncbi:cobalamin biosynthesis protein B [Brachyspira hampsonii 30446]|uniref:Cobalamin biosynthesis protein B n=1 Tax=Brachyspira hampsonii 30446 TaxID=1289135 RepID=A0A2U4F8I9_9SPIR|nr:cobalamin biosynthesis protein [Brachyspira hampsonii]EKV57670.1 cobalamin biosynthesis protein B [Brachyspira hampsonii 30446]MBW5394094.1 cobalamin biosynthesis protein CbiB [Brachyspira hampsonii]OEJ20616.1 cobalamin biosynthesis protein CbiB [Brachyspira hampsonii]